MELRLTRPREKWFFLIALPIAIVIEWAFARSLDWTVYPRSEWVALFDLCVFMPLVYLFAFSSTPGRKTRLLRAAGIAGLGLLAARFIVPDANQFVLNQLSAIRNAMLVFVLLFEGWVLWKVIGAVYRKGADVKQLEQDFAMPAWIARLMVLEAKFWKAVWRFVRGK
jgi:hypothetical protein